jgi:iron complex outermembrane recepter protein
VINIVTKTAQETKGALVRVGAGTFDRAQVTARYGGSLGAGAYRVYAQWTDRGNTQLGGAAFDDNWSIFTTGARADWTRGADEWTVDGSARTGAAHTIWKLPNSLVPDLAPQIDDPNSFNIGHVLGRWTHRFADASSIQVQSSATILRRTEFITVDEQAFDTEAQYHGRFGRRHDVVAGVGARLVKSATGSSFALSFEPSSDDNLVTNVFLQDEVALPGRLHLTLGTKLEHEPRSGWGLQPTARLMWSPVPRQHLWAGASRALRTPALADTLVRVNAIVLPGEPPVVVAFEGNPDYQAETFHDMEAGYRLQIGSVASFDVTTFRGRYSGLPTREPLPPVFVTTAGPPHVVISTRTENRLQADTAGVEIAVRLTPTPAWRVDGSLSTFHLTPHIDAVSQDAAAAAFDGNAPARQWQVHTSLDLGRRTQIDGTVFHVGPLKTLAVPAYTRGDLRVEVVLTGHLTLSAVGKNLFVATHAEYASPQIVTTRIPRSANIQLAWTY